MQQHQQAFIIDQRSLLHEGLSDLPVLATIDTSRQHINAITQQFFSSFDELLHDVASYANHPAEAKNIFRTRNLLRTQQLHITHEIETLFIWSLLPGNTSRVEFLETLMVEDMSLGILVEKLRELHVPELQTIEAMYPRFMPGISVNTQTNPFEPMNIYGIAYSVFKTLAMDERSINLCLREFHSVLKERLRSFYRAIIKILNNA